MKIPALPYHQVTNELLYSLLTGGDCIGYAELEARHNTISVLVVPEKAVYAMMVVEADITTTDKEKVIRFKETPVATDLPTSSSGIPLGDLGVYEVKGTANLKNFKVTGIEAGKVHVIRIQFFA